MPDNCPICRTELRAQHTHRPERYFFECPRCGPYSLSSSADASLGYYLGKYPDAEAKLSHALYKLTEREQWAMLTTATIEAILETATLPRPQEQLENFIVWLGQKQAAPGHPLEITGQTQAAVGVANEIALGFICSHAVAAGLVGGVVDELLDGNYAFGQLQLTFMGWARFEELQRGRSSSRIAFMAMQFGDPELDRVYRDCFMAAVGAAGFQLKRLDEGQPAGLIDDRLRVEIRQSRFLLADLTHQNRGAYWEAGFAEGLGKPVIYTCRKDAFHGDGTHFDTNHHLTVIWEPGNEGEAAEKLKATIRATLPEEATQAD